jgi:hypothetical protein
VFNTRRAVLKDVRVRQALGLAMDYEWMNRQMFYNAYQRVNGLFGNTDCAATGEPGAEELALLSPWRSQVPPAVFGPMAKPPRTDGDHSLRGNLLQAKALLADAGWVYRDGALRNAQGQALELEYLDSNENGARVVTPWIRNLEKLGVTLKFRPVDFALYQQRLQKFEFDITSYGVWRHTQPRAGICRPVRQQSRCHRRLWQLCRCGQPSGGCADHRHDRCQNQGRVAARLPCAGARDCPQPLPGAAVVSGHTPAGLQRLAVGPPRHHAALHPRGRGMGDGHLVVQSIALMCKQKVLYRFHLFNSLLLNLNE